MSKNIDTWVDGEISGIQVWNEKFDLKFSKEVCDLIHRIVEKSWGYKKYPVPDIMEIFNHIDMYFFEPDGRKRRSNFHRACKKVGLEGGMYYIMLRNQPVESVNKSRRNGFSWRFEHLLLINLHTLKYTTFHITG